MKVVKKVLTLLLILTIISQIFIPSNVKAQNTIRTYDSNSLYDEVAKNAVLDNKRSEYVASDTGIDFTKGASSTNGQGVYTIASTKDDLYPIHYYRGNIDNNNVLFGGFCWQIVRTTETGGVKLIYNGKPVDGKCENPERDSNLKADSFQSGSYMYGIDINKVSNNLFNYNYYFLPTAWYDLVDFLSYSINFNVINDISSESFYYTKDVEYFEDTYYYRIENAKHHHNRGESIEEIKNMDFIYYTSAPNYAGYSVNAIAWDTYNEENDSVGYFELSNGLTYDDVEQLKKKNLVFANEVEYKNGKYELKDSITIPLTSLNIEENIKKVLDGHHYFCNDFSNSCDKVEYIYDYYYDDYDAEYDFFYTTFTSGYKVDDIYNEFKNSSNENDSQTKKLIDKWYGVYLTDETVYLEDTIWCNDRSMGTDVFNRNFNLMSYYNNQKLKLNLTCQNKNDRFTVNNKNGNGKLTYPVATITDREVIYAGSPSEYINENGIEIIGRAGPTSYISNYVYDDYSDFLTMTQYHFGENFYAVNAIGELDYPKDYCSRSIKTNSIMPINSVCTSKSFVRPMVSLKHSMIVSSGDGSPTNPYEVVEGNTVEYVIDGDMPKGFLPPEVESYLKGSKVKMNGLKAGDIINGYRFLGWQTKDVEVVDGAFDMPENKVVFVGRFEKIEDSPLTYDSISKYLTTGIIGVVGLAGLVLLKKKI